VVAVVVEPADGVVVAVPGAVEVVVDGAVEVVEPVVVVELAVDVVGEGVVEGVDGALAVPGAPEPEADPELPFGWPAGVEPAEALPPPDESDDVRRWRSVGAPPS
jgi:hypothetical protein